MIYSCPLIRLALRRKHKKKAITKTNFSADLFEFQNICEKLRQRESIQLLNKIVNFDGKLRT